MKRIIYVCKMSKMDEFFNLQFRQGMGQPQLIAKHHF